MCPAHRNCNFTEISIPEFCSCSELSRYHSKWFLLSESATCCYRWCTSQRYKLFPLFLTRTTFRVGLLGIEMKKWVEFGKCATYLYFANVNGFDSWSLRKVCGTSRVVESWDLRADDWVTLHSMLLFCMTLPSLSAPSPGLPRVSSNLGTYLFEKCTICLMCYKQGVWLQASSLPGFTSCTRWDQDVCICFHKFLLWFGAFRGQRGCQSKLKQAASETFSSARYHPAAILRPSVGTLPFAPGPRKMKSTFSPLKSPAFPPDSAKGLSLGGAPRGTGI